jgi:hypothetical protein
MPVLGARRGPALEVDPPVLVYHFWVALILLTGLSNRVIDPSTVALHFFVL